MVQATSDRTDYVRSVARRRRLHLERAAALAAFAASGDRADYERAMQITKRMMACDVPSASRRAS